MAAQIALALSAASCSQDTSHVSSAACTPIIVDAARATRTRETSFQSVAGSIRPFDRALVSARVAGTVTGANFALGQSVLRGDLLLTLQADELAARLHQAEAALNQADRDAAREARLVSEGASTAEAARAAADRLHVARAALEEAKVLAGYTRVTAPFAGVITRKLVDSGDHAEPGAALFELEACDRMRADLAVPAELPVPNLNADIRVTLNGATLVARVAEISPALDAATRTHHIILEFPRGSTVRSGDFVRAQWPAGEFDLISVPVEAVRSIGQIEQVFTVVGDRAVLRIVRTGWIDGSRAQIVSGLQAGETVIVSPPAGLRDGENVAVRP
jgi:RND family efflux transporter MFP subunit